MKIVYLVHQFYPEHQTGTEKFVYNNAFMAQKFGNKVKIITYCFYDNSYFDQEDDGILSKEYIFDSLPVLAFKYKNTPIDINIALGNRLLNKFAKKILIAENPDIIHVGHPMRIHEFISVAKEMKIPYLITLTDFFLLCPKVILAPNQKSLCSGPHKGTACSNLCNEYNSEFITKRLDFSEDILRNSKEIISPSKFVANVFIKEYGSLNIRIINHGLRYKYICNNNRIYNKNDILVFGYAGSLAFHKGVHVLLSAFNSIDNKNIRLVIFGSGQEEYVNRLKKIAENDNRVIFRGAYSTEQLCNVYKTVDILIIPSICYETYQLVLHEALASGVPVIASGLGGMAEKIKDDLNGFTFIPGDSNDLRIKMELLVNNVDIVNKLKENIKNEIPIPMIEQEAYSYSKIYYDLYKR